MAWLCGCLSLSKMRLNVFSLANRPAPARNWQRSNPLACSMWHTGGQRRGWSTVGQQKSTFPPDFDDVPIVHFCNFILSVTRERKFFSNYKPITTSLTNHIKTTHMHLIRTLWYTPSRLVRSFNIGGADICALSPHWMSFRVQNCLWY